MSDVLPNRTMRNLKFIVLVVFLTVLCTLIIADELFSYSSVHVKVEQQDIKYASIKNAAISQEIYCEGRIKRLGITLYAPSGAMYEDAEVVISVEQKGKTVVTESISAKKLRTICSYVVNAETAREENPKGEMVYFLRSDLRKITKGSAVVRVMGLNLPEGTDVFCEVSASLVSGLPSARLDDIHILGNPIVVEYDVLRFDAHFKYELSLIVLLLLFVMITAYLVVYRPPLLAHHNVLFWCAAAMVFLIISIRNPYASFWGEPRSEALYEFYYKANSLNFWENLMSLMSGESLAWWERILMWTANVISTKKNVFVVAQLMESVWIALAVSMPCCKSFKKYYSDVTRLAISLLLGTAYLFDSAYFFWSCSYWALPFLFCFFLLPLEDLSPFAYYCGLVLSVILCISRIYHVIFVPVCILTLLVCSKQLSGRKQKVLATVAISSSFEFLYSMLSKTNLSAGESLLSGISDIGFFRIIENTIYYQIQVINSIFGVSSTTLGFGKNLLSLAAFGSIILLFVCTLSEKKTRIYSCVIGGLGCISLGTIAINIYTAGTFYNVSFPRNYAALVNWSGTIFQEGDLHFSYAYFSLLLIILCAIYYCKTEVLPKWRYGGDNESVREENSLSPVCDIIVLLLVICIAANGKPRIGVQDISVEWKEVYSLTEHEPCFLAVNTVYGTAHISCEIGTDEMIFGVDEDGVLYEWHDGLHEYEYEVPYHIAEIGAVSASEQRPIISVTARRALTNFDVVYVAVLRDRENTELGRTVQVQRDSRLWLDFVFEKPINDVYSISFELIDGNPAYIQDGLQVGYVCDTK